MVRFAILLMLAQAAGNPAADGVAGRVVVLSDTGQTRGTLPVAVPHPDAARYEALLSRGYARRVVRLYAMVQRFAHPDRPPQPAYLLLTDHQGGFPRQGLFLDASHPGLAYVDLHRRSTPSGRPGAMDQIYPHELLHIIVGELAGAMPEGRATQVHAVGVRTDRVTAFNEGFAEHGQLMAIDDAGAPPETRAIASNAAMRDGAFADMRAYRTALTARWSVAPASRMTFPVWFSRSEQILRYHAVRDNLFARQPVIPDRLLTVSAAYRAYLLDNVLPGSPADPPKSAARMLATEGVISHLFYRLVNDSHFQKSRAPAELYDRFGVTPAAIDGLDNAYLKLFSAIQTGGYDALKVFHALAAAFPDDRAAVERVIREGLLHQPVSPAPELWMLNAGFPAGTTLFDQFRGAPIAQAFDLNAASPAELAAVPGIDPSTAAAILRAAPFADVGDLRRVPLDADRLARFERMRKDMLKPPAPGTEREGTLSFKTILMPYAWRALAVWIACAAIGSVAYRRVRSIRWWRAILNGTACALLALLAAWIFARYGALAAIAVPAILLGGPGAAVQLWRHAPRQAARVLGAWIAAAAPSLLAVTPLF